jgi:hypothetical protein
MPLRGPDPDGRIGPDPGFATMLTFSTLRREVGPQYADAVRARAQSVEAQAGGLVLASLGAAATAGGSSPIVIEAAKGGLWNVVGGISTRIGDGDPETRAINRGEMAADLVAGTLATTTAGAVMRKGRIAQALGPTGARLGDMLLSTSITASRKQVWDLLGDALHSVATEGANQSASNPSTNCHLVPTKVVETLPTVSSHGGGS